MQEEILIQLLQSGGEHSSNLELLKKIVLTAYLGRLEINGQAPDNRISFADYLFDDEHVVFDFSRLNEVQKEKFKQWLLDTHQSEKKTLWTSSYSVNEYRGFTSEEKLSWWGRLKKRFNNEPTEYWKVNDLAISTNYQLLGLEICHGLNGFLLGFHQLLTPPSRRKYKRETVPEVETLGNTKRVFISNSLVDKLTKINIKNYNFEAICKNSHPFALDITDDKGNDDNYYHEMRQYRSIQKFNARKPWYVRLWQWIVEWFVTPEPVEKVIHQPPPISKTKNVLHRDETTSLYRRANGQIIVQEKRPEIENMVFCGGGGKIFAHIGVWKSLNESHIVPERFAGSSAGAIMALMCYLGYNADEIEKLFADFKHENLVYFDPTVRGISEPNALKAALDYAVALKLKQIITQHNQTNEQKVSYPQGKITFATLEMLRVQCPNSGLGKELVVTATNKNLRKTKYLSLNKTPNMEVSEAVKISASLPVVFRDTRLDDGQDYSDGGVLNNFPTDVFHEDDTTFLESEYGNNMKTLAVQFDSGTERSAVDKIKDPVHRENIILNGIYSLLTGVRDPVSAWEQDRLKLRKYAAQSILVDTLFVSGTTIGVPLEDQKKLINNGYEAGRAYIHARYSQKESSVFSNRELMHKTFSSFEELLAYCCYKGNKKWFDRIYAIVEKGSDPNREQIIKYAQKLSGLYFTSTLGAQKETKKSDITLFKANIQPQSQFHSYRLDHDIFLALYPVFLKLSTSMVKNQNEFDIIERVRHSLSQDNPYKCLPIFSLFKDEIHLILTILHKTIEELERVQRTSPLDPMQLNKVFSALEMINKVLCDPNKLSTLNYFSKWDIDFNQSYRVLVTIEEKSPYIHTLCGALKRNKIPMQIYNGKEFVNDDFDPEQEDLEIGSSGISP